MWLAIDCGNARLKWAAVQNGLPGEVRTIPISPTRASSFSSLQNAAAKASDAWISHVGSALPQKTLRGILRECKQLRFVQSAAKDGGVVNRYRPPSSLGTDRWLALVAAREMNRDVAIVNAGTAATIDFLRADGVFIGGAILAGMNLSRESIARRTGLHFNSQQCEMILPPQNTNAALVAGAVSSVAGAALFLRKRILPGARFVVGGGDAELVLPWLPKNTLHLPHPPICGLARLRTMHLQHSRS